MNLTSKFEKKLRKTIANSTSSREKKKYLFETITDLIKKEEVYENKNITESGRASQNSE